ncbi:MAG TPA: hypothetical protein QF710_03875 [Candidatus Nitrosopelagicus sp.]|nr:hypothetical protein [Candidatus Nitrosopelagicus sp.]
MKPYYIIIILFGLVFLPSILFVEADLDTDPFSAGTQFDSTPLDEAEQEKQELTDLWTIAVAIVAGLLIVRIAYKIIKKRMSRST